MEEKFERIYMTHERYEEKRLQLIKRVGTNEMSNNPLISIVIPVYNTEQYLEDCLLSVLEQEEKNIEIICVNDGSTDLSSDILEEFASIDARIKIISQENHGLAYARNTAFPYVKGKYLLYLDSDDMLRQGTLTELLHVAEEYKTNIVCFDAECRFMPGIEFDAVKDKYYWKKISYGFSNGKEMFARMYTQERFTDSACLMFINREWLVEQGITFYNGILYEDCLFSVQCMMKADRVFHVNKKYYIYRVRNNSIMTSNSFRAENLYSRVLELQKFIEIYKNEEFTEYQQVAFVKWIRGIIASIGRISKGISDIELERLFHMPNAKQLMLELELASVPWDKPYKKDLMRDKLVRLKNDLDIIIYGAGIRGKRLLEYFYLLDNAVRVKGFVVTEQNNQPKKIRNMPVYCLDQGYVIDEKAFIIISFRGEEAVLLKNALEEKGYKNILVLDDELHAEVCAYIKQELKL